MKKIVLMLICIIVLSGCGKSDKSSLINDLNKKVENSKNYQITATLDIFRNEEKITYNIISTYKKGDYFKVELINKTNNHKQIILRDTESVYVLTPSINKSFKFQSEWPYNNSQIYLLQPILLDVINDKNSELKETNKGYVVISNVNYSSEKDYKKQKVYFDMDKNLKKVEVIDDKENIKMCLEIINIEYDIKLESDFFDINKYKKDIESEESKKEHKEETTNETINYLDEIVYPMYVPTDTYLAGQDIITTETGERVILTFVGNSKFTLIQESLDDNEIQGYVYGDPYLILDTVGVITDYSVSWISNDVEYSVISNTMSVDELLTVAQSINVEPVGK